MVLKIVPFELKQQFTVDTLQREIMVAMTLYNRSSKAQTQVSASLNIDAF